VMALSSAVCLGVSHEKSVAVRSHSLVKAILLLKR
jgi:hypothetical protein